MGRSFLNEATLGGLENAFKSLAHFGTILYSHTVSRY